MFFRIAVTTCLVFATLTTASARDVHVDNLRGDDRNNGEIERRDIETVGHQSRHRSPRSGIPIQGF